MSWTRLFHVKSGRLYKYPVQAFPPFVAISHAWGDALFPTNTTFHFQEGSKAIHCLLAEIYPNVEHCWIDTLCIDQSDPEDKKRQIPLMGEIYGKAEVVAIIFKTAIGLAQKEVDRIVANVEGAVEMVREGNWKDEGQKWQTKQRRRHLKEAMDCLELFTRSPWATRVWTLQEFVLGKATVWIGQDLVPLRINEELFMALPLVCDNLNISECVLGKYSILYHYYMGMAGARLEQIDKTRIMELLGNRTASFGVDEIFGTMAASGVVIDQIDVETKEEAWRLWWEAAVRQGHVRWALLPPGTPTPGGTLRLRGDYLNCAMPAFSTRHLASFGSGLDTVTPLGEVKVEDGMVTMAGRFAGVCRIIKRLGRLQLDATGLVYRDITLILFGSNNWAQCLRTARAFGGGRYNPKQIRIIAQVLKHNFYRAKLVVFMNRQGDFRPFFRNGYYKSIWSDFMLLQSVHMMVMNKGVAFLAEMQNEQSMADIVIVAEDEEHPKGKLIAVDFGAEDKSGRTLLATLEVPEISLDFLTSYHQSASPLHKFGVVMALDITTLENAIKYSAFTLSDHNEYYFSIGGRRCTICISRAIESEKSETAGRISNVRQPRTQLDQRSKQTLLLKMRQQNRVFKGRVRPAFSLSKKINRRQNSVKLRRRISQRILNLQDSI